MRNERNLYRALMGKGTSQNEFVLKKMISEALQPVIASVSELTEELAAVKEDVENIGKLVKATVTFNSDGGSEVQSQDVVYGGKATKPEDPTQDGYTFVCWTLNGEEFDFDTAIKENITLKATWEPVE